MTTTRLWIIGAALVMAVIGALGWFLGISPRLSDARSADEERVAVETLNQTYQLKLLELQKLDKDLPKLEDKLADLRAALPQDAEIATLLGELNALAADSQVELTEITAGAPADFEIAAPAPVEAPTTETPDPAATPEAAGLVVVNVVSVPITVRVTGTAPSIMDFIDNVQFGTRLFLVTGLNITIEAASGTAEIEGLVYVLIDPASDADTKSAPAG